MTLEHGLRRTIPTESILREIRRRVYHPRERRGAIAGWLAGFWDFLLGR